MGDISRRNFLKGTGKTILTAGALSSGVLTTSSTPVKTATTATTTWKNLNVLSPTAKAYRSYLRGLKSWTTAASLVPKKYKGSTKNILGSKLRSSGKLGSFISKQRVDAKTGIKATTGESLARLSFRHSITSNKAGFPIAKSTAPGRLIAGQLDLPTGPLKNRIASDIHTSARKELASELRAFRKANPDRMHKKVSAKIHKENVDKRKVKSKKGRGMGGGKFIGDGVETPRNPTGMSLITRRSILM
tara:strand:- start:3 stop:740 length:738 start_codon:yes stop_codon:yes gene_type:complete